MVGALYYTNLNSIGTNRGNTGPVADPSTLCPWCDETLPYHPSEGLLAMITVARQRSVPSPRPANRLGLRAPIPVFAGVCSAHDLEKYDMGIALAEGWPTEVDWRVFIQRVVDLSGYIQSIIDDVDEEWRPLQTDDTMPVEHQQLRLVEDPQLLAHRPRKESVLWKSLMNTIARRGSLHTAGILGQYGNFGKLLPG